jgi:hypothetical protein
MLPRPRLWVPFGSQNNWPSPSSRVVLEKLIAAHVVKALRFLSSLRTITACTGVWHCLMSWPTLPSVHILISPPPPFCLCFVLLCEVLSLRDRPFSAVHHSLFCMSGGSIVHMEPDDASFCLDKRNRLSRFCSQSRIAFPIRLKYWLAIVIAFHCVPLEAGTKYSVRRIVPKMNYSVWVAKEQCCGSSADRLDSVRTLGHPPLHAVRLLRCYQNVDIFADRFLTNLAVLEVEVSLRLTVSMCWYRAPLWDLRPDITSCRNVAVWNSGLVSIGPLSDERTALSFVVEVTLRLTVSQYVLV